MAHESNPPRKFDDAKVAEYVEWIKTNDNDAWLSYLVVRGLNAHLAKYISSSPS